MANIFFNVTSYISYGMVFNKSQDQLVLLKPLLQDLLYKDLFFILYRDLHENKQMHYFCISEMDWLNDKFNELVNVKFDKLNDELKSFLSNKEANKIFSINNQKLLQDEINAFLTQLQEGHNEIDDLFKNTSYDLKTQLNLAEEYRKKKVDQLSLCIQNVQQAFYSQTNLCIQNVQQAFYSQTNCKQQ